MHCWQSQCCSKCWASLAIATLFSLPNTALLVRSSVDIQWTVLKNVASPVGLWCCRNQWDEEDMTQEVLYEWPTRCHPSVSHTDVLSSTLGVVSRCTRYPFALLGDALSHPFSSSNRCANVWVPFVLTHTVNMTSIKFRHQTSVKFC